VGGERGEDMSKYVDVKSDKVSIDLAGFRPTSVQEAQYVVKNEQGTRSFTINITLQPEVKENLTRLKHYLKQNDINPSDVIAVFSKSESESWVLKELQVHTPAAKQFFATMAGHKNNDRAIYTLAKDKKEPEYGLSRIIGHVALRDESLSKEGWVAQRSTVNTITTILEEGAQASADRGNGNSEVTGLPGSG
jgi:hypothetical protein